MSWIRSQSLKTIYEVDSPIAKEIAPTTISVSGTLTGLRIRGSSGLDGAKIMNIANPELVFTQKYVTIEIVDRLTDRTLYTFTDAVFDSDSWRAENRSLMAFSASFKAKFVTTESEG